jgi:type VI secretion system protein ImpH
MATTSGTPDSRLSEALVEQSLRDDAPSFEFFQAVSLLQRLHPERHQVGEFSHPQSEVVHFRVNNELAFPASQIQQLQWSDTTEQAEMMVNFMGLTGPSGVLPYFYTELILERLRAKDRSLETFLDIFNHRSISLFYRAWQKYRFPVTYSSGDRDRFTHHLFDLIGMGTPGMLGRQAIPDEALLHYVGLLGMQARSAVALEEILKDYFGVPIDIEQFTGDWHRLSANAQCRLDDDEEPAQQLGTGAVVGDEVWSQQSRVRIKIGPLTLEQYRDFLPDGSAFEPLKAITRFFSGDELDFEIQLILRREETPGFEIDFDSREAPRLGWVTWLKSVPLDRDPHETVLAL